MKYRIWALTTIISQAMLILCVEMGIANAFLTIASFTFMVSALVSAIFLYRTNREVKF